MGLSAPMVRKMPAQEYFAAPGLSFSGMKDLAISPLRFWHRRINPNAPVEEESAEMTFGKALHTAVLEPAHFESRYAREVVLEEIPGCLRTINEMRDWLKSKGRKGEGSLKAEIIKQVLAVDPNQPILDVLKAENEVANAGKVILKAPDFQRVHSCAAALLDEPRMRELLDGLEIEQALFRRDEETGVLLKGRPDGMKPKFTLEPKTFSQRAGKSIDESIADAIWYQRYTWQAFQYALLRGWPEWDGDHIMPFVESEAPHEVRIKVLRSKTYGQPNLYFERARLEVRGLIRKYADNMKHFGDQPWRFAAEADALEDSEIRALSYS